MASQSAPHLSEQTTDQGVQAIRSLRLWPSELMRGTLRAARCDPCDPEARQLDRPDTDAEKTSIVCGGRTQSPGEVIYFKVYKSQLPVIEQGLETAGLMLGSDKSRGYCLEMICADFLAGASLESGEVKSLTAACPHESGLATGHKAPDAKTNS